MGLRLRLVWGAAGFAAAVACGGPAFNSSGSAGGSSGGGGGGDAAISGAGTAGAVGQGGATAGGGTTANAGMANAGMANAGMANAGSASGGASGGGSAGTGGSSGVLGGGGVAGAGGSSGSAASGAGGSGGHTSTLRLMPLGDGITATTCYRAKLWQDFAAHGRTDFDFVGTRNGGDACGVSASYDKDNEGHGGYQVTDVLKAVTTGRPDSADQQDPYDASAKDLITWFDGHPLDILLIHMGSNDILKLSATTDSILSAYSAIVARARLTSPNVTVFVAQLLPMNVSSCGTCLTQIQTLNQAIPGWATMTDTDMSHVHVVNQYAGFDVANTSDGIRPNEVGAQIMADKWYSAIVQAFP